MSERLATWLIDERVLPKATVQAAAARQLVYGGALDTAILEIGAMTEAAIWGRLSAATGLPVPAPGLCDEQLTDLPPSLDADRTGPLRAVPVAAEAGTLKLLCGEPVAIDEIRAAAADSGFVARLYVVPEVRLLAARQRVYREPLPARYAPLLARILGTEGTRKNHRTPRAATSGVSGVRSAASAVASAPFNDGARGGDAVGTPLEHVLDLSGALPADSSLELDFEIPVGAQPITPMADPPSGPMRLELASAETRSQEQPGRREATEPDGDPAVPQETPFGPDSESGNHPATAALCRRARDPRDRGRPLALRVLRSRLTHPAVQTLLTELHAVVTGREATEAIEAIEALVELRDPTVIPALIERLDRATPPDVAQAIHRALVALTAQDFGRSRRRWQAWWQRSGRRPRTEWLLDGLAHKQPEVRMAASEELRQMAGDSFGYLFDMPKREREDARQRWLSWWESGGGTSEDPILSGSLLGLGDEFPLPPAPKAR